MSLKTTMLLLLMLISLVSLGSCTQDEELFDTFSEFIDPVLDDKRPQFTSPVLVDSNCRCGQLGSGRNDDDKIINGIEVLPNYKYPWMALLMRNGNFICGGSLINKRYVLTAAHCVKDRTPGIYEVYLGIHNISDLRSSNLIQSQPFAKKFLVEKVKINGRYDGKRSDSSFDIALLKLSQPVTYTDQISPVCLPEYESVYSQPTTDSVVIGWGNTEANRISTVLKEATVLVFGPEECRKQSKYGTKIQNDMICAAAEGKDSCQGDSGGPLFIRTESAYLQIGIVSWGNGCALKGYPGVYASVSALLGFIYAGTKTAVYCEKPL